MDLINYEVLSIKKRKFKDCRVDDDFFVSLKNDYKGFQEWFVKKADKEVYTHSDIEGNIQGLLYLKEETEEEDYSEMETPFEPRRRLKIGTFKISENGYYMGERFFKVIFENAIKNDFKEIYVTIFPHHELLISYFIKFGFKQETKISETGELVFTRKINVYEKNDYEGYPILNTVGKNYYLLPIKPEYHTRLLPDAILNTEDNSNYTNNNKAGNALKKVYFGKILWAHQPRNGDVIFFYRTRDHSNASPAHYQSVITSIGVVSGYGDTNQLRSIELEKLLNRCVLDEKEMAQIRNPMNRYKFLEFVYFGKLDYRAVNLGYMRENNIEAPRGIDLIPPSFAFSIIEKSRYSEGIIVK